MFSRSLRPCLISKFYPFETNNTYICNSRICCVPLDAQMEWSDCLTWILGDVSGVMAKQINIFVCNVQNITQEGPTPTPSLLLTFFKLRSTFSLCTLSNNEYWKSVLFKFVMISPTGIFNAVRITIKCVWYWLPTGMQWKILWYCSPRNCYWGILVLCLFTKSLWVTHIWKLLQFHTESKVYCHCNLFVIVIWGSKYLILMLEICMVEGSLKVHVFFSKHSLLIV